MHAKGVFMAEKQSLDKNLESAAVNPKKVDIDGQVIESHSLSELIELDKYLSAKKAVKSRRGGLRISKMCHGGAE
jgi:hypothetical protein